MKKVSFTNKNTIYTIPTTNDMSLWWKSHDYENSYKNMKEELNTFTPNHDYTRSKIYALSKTIHYI
jgi:hypothetical protein